MPMPECRVYNVVPDSYDHRDFVAAVAHSAQVAALPSAYDLRGTSPAPFPPVWDQGQEGSCTAHGALAIAEIQRRAQGLAPLDPSRQAQYYFTRDAEGDPKVDAGAQVRTAVSVMADVGIAEASLWPYNMPKFTKPGADVYADAATRKVSQYIRLDGSPQTACAAIASGKAVVFGMQVYKAFEATGPGAIASTGILSLPNTCWLFGGEKSLGGHCVCAVGYLITNSDPSAFDGYFTCRNSWGPDWGKSGYFLMPFAYFSRYSFDCWTVDQVTA